MKTPQIVAIVVAVVFLILVAYLLFRKEKLEFTYNVNDSKVFVRNFEKVSTNNPANNPVETVQSQVASIPLYKDGKKIGMLYTMITNFNEEKSKTKVIQKMLFDFDGSVKPFKKGEIGMKLVFRNEDDNSVLTAPIRCGSHEYENARGSGRIETKGDLRLVTLCI